VHLPLLHHYCGTGGTGDLRNKNLLRPTEIIISHLLISVKLAKGDRYTAKVRGGR
jgi:hypothetical protein